MYLKIDLQEQTGGLQLPLNSLFRFFLQLIAVSDSRNLNLNSNFGILPLLTFIVQWCVWQGAGAVTFC